EPPVVEPPDEFDIHEPCAAGTIHHEVTMAVGDDEDCDAIDNPPLGGLNYHWEVDPWYSYGCDNPEFEPNDTTQPITEFSIDAPFPCDALCVVTLTVSDCRHGHAAPYCDPTPTFVFQVIVDDDQAPVLSGCP